MHYREDGHLDGCTVTVDQEGIGEVALQVYYRTYSQDDNYPERVYRADDTKEEKDICNWIDKNYPGWWLEIVDAVDAASVDFWR